MVYIMGAVFSRTEGYTGLANLTGPIIFHVACMVLGGFCFLPTVQKASSEAAVPAVQS
jgi:hypothetical protein